MQSSQNRGDRIASPCTGKYRIRARVEDSLQLPEIFSGCSIEKGVTVADDGKPSSTDHRICHHTSRLLVNTSTYKALMVEMSRLTYIIHVTVEGKLILRGVENDARGSSQLIVSNFSYCIFNIDKNCYYRINIRLLLYIGSA